MRPAYNDEKRVFKKPTFFGLVILLIRAFTRKSGVCLTFWLDGTLNFWAKSTNCCFLHWRMVVTDFSPGNCKSRAISLCCSLHTYDPFISSPWSEVKWSEVKSLSRVWLFCDPMDCSLQGSSVHGIFQATVLEWVAISFSRAHFWARDRTRVACIACGRFTVWATKQAHNEH